MIRVKLRDKINATPSLQNIPSLEQWLQVVGLCQSCTQVRNTQLIFKVFDQAIGFRNVATKRNGKYFPQFSYICHLLWFAILIVSTGALINLNIFFFFNSPFTIIEIICKWMWMDSKPVFFLFFVVLIIMENVSFKITLYFIIFVIVKSCIMLFILLVGTSYEWTRRVVVFLLKPIFVFVLFSTFAPE